jgi:phosphatidylserine/phosphatidylglycerophosphate/cardiolipin synthase-like enzyme
MRVSASAFVLLLALVPSPASAQTFCDPAGSDCRAVLLRYITSERVRIDVGMEEMTDAVLADALIARHRAGLPVRLLVEPRRSKYEPRNKPILDKLKTAGLPMRYKPAGDILHWKTMIFAGQFVVEFGAAQFSTHYLIPVQPFVNFAQDPIAFVTDTALVNSFKRKFDDAWVSTSFANYANAASPVRAYPELQGAAISADLNFVPGENFLTRSTPLYDAERSAIDVIMYKVQSAGHADAMIRAIKRGVPVRLILEPARYRNRDNVYHAYHVDRMWAAAGSGGRRIQIRERAHAGFTHQKTTLLHGQRRTIFGSSNWTDGSNRLQYEHNYLGTDPEFFAFFRDVFLRKWASTVETRAFVPLPPDTPVYTAPVNGTSGLAAPVSLKWKPGAWAWRADVYLGTANPPPLYKSNVSVSPNTTRSLDVSAALAAGRTYYWKIVSKTMAGKTKTGAVWSFGT